MNTAFQPVQTIRWKKPQWVEILDQRLLPLRKKYIRCRTHRQIARAIREMAIRGAPAIGDAAAFGMALAAGEKKFSSRAAFLRHMEKAKKLLASTRPTAVNLCWALDRMMQKTEREALWDEAEKIFREDLEACLAIGRYGAELLTKPSRILTHCNAGSLATAGHGTATAVIYTGFEKGRVQKVLVDETRPYLQGSRLTAWELRQYGVPCEVITDNMAGHFMKAKEVDAVIVGADRIAANGDTANKIGTYTLAVLARHHGIPFYVAAPVSTVDLATPDGDRIPIEERPGREVRIVGKTEIAPRNVPVRHPAFDVTPAEFISAIITDRGVCRPPYSDSLRRLHKPPADQGEPGGR